jgi:hypothetical protein
MSASLVCGVACVTSPPSREPDPPAPTTAPAVIVEPSPSASAAPQAAAVAVSSDEPPATELTGIPECDVYLALYQRCEEYLQPQIMAGVRRSHRAEQGSLVYYASTPEAATMASSCKSMLDQLQVDCPEQHRSPP